jgi:hypothetical protein
LIGKANKVWRYLPTPKEAPKYEDAGKRVMFFYLGEGLYF